MTTTKAKILIVDDEKSITEVLSASLRDENYRVEVVNSGDAAIPLVEKFRPDVVLLDIWMPGSKDGIDVLRETRARYPQTEFLIMSGHGTIETAVRATKLGAWDFVEKPLSMDKISILIHNILLYQEAQRQKNALLNRMRKNIALVGESPSMVLLKQQIAQLAPKDEPLLVRGELGTGKELVAQNIHYLGLQAGQPFVEVSCSSVPADLMESELFGHEKGFFPGATETKRGKLELADHGILFLDEICDLSLKIQEKLVKVLKDKTFERLGSKEVLNSSAKLILASSRNLEKGVKEGKVLPELMYLFASHILQLPPLRERREDIASLTLHFSEYFAKQGGYRLKNFSSQSMSQLQSYAWPGNVRELRNFIERVFILVPGDFVDLEQLRVAGMVDTVGFETESGGEASLKDARARFERDFILKKLDENAGNISKTAETIGVERSHLHRKIKGYGIETKEPT